MNGLSIYEEPLRGLKYSLITKTCNTSKLNTSLINDKQDDPYSSLNLTFHYYKGQGKAQENQMHCPDDQTMMMGAMTMKGSHF